MHCFAFWAAYKGEKEVFEALEKTKNPRTDADFSAVSVKLRVKQ